MKRLTRTRRAQRFISACCLLRNCAAPIMLILILQCGVLHAAGTPADTRKTKFLQVTGKVTDEGGVPLPGVSVRSKTGRSTAVTGTDGTYRIEVDAVETLIFSSIGYLSKEVQVSSQSVVDVILSEDKKALEEVVVVGYGTQSREKLIGSVSQIRGDQIKERPVTQLKDALTGQMPGVTVTQRGGRPGQASGTLSVRGVGSFGASPGALVVVDGIIVNNLNDIDPNDVESISVLKDASSSAIYGARAANGVVLVTTKKGNSGAPRLSFGSYLAKQVATRFPQFVNSWEYQEAYFGAINSAGGGSATLTDDQAAEVARYRAQDDPNYPNNNFLDLALSKDGFLTGNNVTLSGGGTSNTYNVSLGYLYQDGMVERNDYNRYNLRMNMNTTISPKLSLETRLSGIASKTNEPSTPVGGTGGDMLGVIGQSVRLPSTLVARYPNGDYGVGLGAGTTFSDLANNSFSINKTINFNGNMRLNYNPLPGLKLSFIPAYTLTNLRDRVFKATMRLNPTVALGPNRLTEQSATTEYYTLQGLAEYTKQLKKHYFGVLAGYSFEDSRTNNLEAFRDNFPNNEVTVLRVGSLSNQQADGTASRWALESQFARFNYNFDSRYLFEAVVRRDGSSRFPDQLKYAVFPSVAAAWRIGQEKFMDRFDWLTELKLKASWGELGNQNIDNYPYQNTLVSTQSNAYSYGGNVVQSATRNLLRDTNIHWETTRTTDVGLEAGFFENLVSFSATYFDRKTYDILYSPGTSISAILGFNVSQTNTGSLQNRGWEFTAAHNRTVGKFSYNVSANFSIIDNKVLDLGVGNILQPNGLTGNNTNLFIGHPMNIYYGLVADGLFVDRADIDSYANQNAVNPSQAIRPGDIRYKDISGPNGVPDGVVDLTYDRAILGSEIPKYTYGINIGAKYAGFDFSMLLQGISGVQNQLSGYAAWALYNTTGNIQRWQYEGRWTEQNPDRNAVYPRLENVPGTGVPNTQLSSFWILDGSYMRIKNVQAGYNLPKNLLSKSGVANARIYLSGDNLFTFSNYQQGWDPELVGNQNFYPISSTYTLGLNVTF